MDVVLLVGLVVVWATVAVVAFSIVRRPELRSAPVAEPVPPPAGELERRTADGAVELWWPGGGRLATIREARGGIAGEALRSPWVRRSVGAVLRRALPTPGSGARYRISFPPDLLARIEQGGAIDVVLAGGSLSRVGAGAAAASPAVALAAGAVAVSVAQQQRLDRTLALIERRLDLVIDRLRDDDHGRLDAAEALLEQLDDRVAAVPPAQLRVELAVARQHVDAVYYARRRYVDRLGEAIGDAQEAAAEDTGVAQTWATGVLDAVGDPGQLRSELLVYLRALIVRARLATSTAAVLVADGDLADAGRLLDTTVAELRADFYAIYRRLRPLARLAPRRQPMWKRRDWERAHRTIAEVFELMASDVEPSLPPADPQPLELEVHTDDSGVVDEVRLP